MRNWWKAVAEAWLRHAVPFDADPGGAFRPFVAPRETFPIAGRLEPAEGTSRIAAGARPTHDWGVGYPPPAA